MKTEFVPIESVLSNEENPRTIKDAKLKKLIKSISEFPEMLNLRPIVVDESMIVLGGNMRLKACKEAKLEMIPIIVFTKEMAEKMNENAEVKKSYKQYCDEFVIKDNVGFGDWDWDVLVDNWDTKQLDEWGMDVPDFDFKELVKEQRSDKPKYVKSNIMVTVPIENKKEFLIEVIPIIEKYGASFLENDSSTY